MLVARRTKLFNLPSLTFRFIHKDILKRNLIECVSTDGFKSLQRVYQRLEKNLLQFVDPKLKLNVVNALNFAESKLDPYTSGNLIVLVAEACETSDSSRELLPSQLLIADVVDLLILAFNAHDLVTQSKSDMTAQSSLFDDKIWTLTGDTLLALSYQLLAEVKNASIMGQMFGAAQSLIESSFNVIDLTTVSMVKEYKQKLEEHMYLDGGHLLANGCQCALILSGASLEAQIAGHTIGKYFIYLKKISKHNLLNKTHIHKEMNTLLIQEYKKQALNAIEFFQNKETKCKLSKYVNDFHD